MTEKYLVVALKVDPALTDRVYSYLDALEDIHFLDKSSRKSGLIASIDMDTPKIFGRGSKISVAVGDVNPPFYLTRIKIIDNENVEKIIGNIKSRYGSSVLECKIYEE